MLVKAPSFPLSDPKNGFGPRGLWQQEATCCVISDRRRSRQKAFVRLPLDHLATEQPWPSRRSSPPPHKGTTAPDQSLKVRDGRPVRSGEVVGQLLPSLCRCFISTKSLVPAHLSSTADVRCARTGWGSTRGRDGEECPLKSQLMEPMCCGGFHQHRCDYKTRSLFLMKSRCCEVAALEFGVEDVAVSSWHRFWKFSFPRIQNCRSDIWTEPSRCCAWPTRCLCDALKAERSEDPVRNVRRAFFPRFFLVELSLIPVTHPQARLALDMERKCPISPC